MERYWRDGVQAYSLNELCRRISISKPLVYREFGGEDGLQEAVLEYYNHAVVAPGLRYLSGEQSFASTLDALVTGMTSPAESPAGCLFTEMRVLREHLGPKSLARLVAMETERREAFARWYQHSVETGEANPALTPVDAADYLDAQFTLLLLHMGLGEPPEAVRARAHLALAVLKPSP